MSYLNPTEVAHYQREGWLIPRWRLPAPRVAELTGALDALIAANPGVRPEKLVSAHLEGSAGGSNADGVRGRAEFLALARDREIVELVSEVLGEHLILWGAHVFCKPAGDGYATPWHQDGHYWPIRPLATCTVWLALEPSTRTNGCLRVIARSHAARALHEHLHEDRSDLALNQRLADDSFDEADAVDLELEPGQMSLHDVYMIHGAAANTSSQRRTGIALRYMPASSVFERALDPVAGQSGLAVNFARRPIWLVKGRDVSGLNDFCIGHAQPMDSSHSMRETKA